MTALTSIPTNAQVLNRFELTAQLEVAAMDAVVEFSAHTLQRQGDVLALKQPGLAAAVQAVPAGGIAVVSSEAMNGNTHMLHAYAGDVFFDADPTPLRDERVIYGTLTVAAGASAVLIHTGEHPALGFTEGTYCIRGQVEGAVEIHRVAD